MLKILWLDDKIEKMHSEIQKVRDNLNEEVAITSVSSVDNAISTLKDFRDLSLMILDYDLAEKLVVYDFLNNMKTIKCPIVIYTNFTEEATDNLNKENIPNIYKIINKREPYRLVDFINNMLFFKPFNLIHLSDIHYDSKISNQRKEDQITRIQSFFEGIVNRTDYVAITGDIANKHLSSDYNELLPILKEALIVSLGNDYYEKTYIIPGNHDLHWENYNEGKISNNCFYDYTKFYIELLGDKSKHDLLKYPSDSLPIIENINTCWNRKIKDNVSIIGLNSSTKSVQFKGKGLYIKEHHNIVKNSWPKEKPTSEIRILLTHHNIFAPPSYSDVQEKFQMIDNGFMIKSLMDHKCDLILSGHTHAPNIFSLEHSSLSDGHTQYKDFNRFTNLSSGTFGGYGGSATTLNNASRLNFKPNKDLDGWEISIEPFQYNIHDAEWVTNMKNERIKL